MYELEKKCEDCGDWSVKMVRKKNCKNQGSEFVILFTATLYQNKRNVYHEHVFHGNSTVESWIWRDGGGGWKWDIVERKMKSFS
jgi:hypothetical protein